MPKGQANKRYTGNFKQMVVETMRKENMSYNETARQFEINDRGIIQRWERIYLEEGAEGLYVERRGRACTSTGTKKGRPPKLGKKDFTADNPDTKWVTDVTEFSLFGTKLYLSPILDLYSENLVSYTISDHPVLSMVTDMLNQA
jgi:transposase InsO family protein